MKHIKTIQSMIDELPPDAIFKKCCNGERVVSNYHVYHNYYLVAMQKLPTTQTNETRSGVVNKQCAKFRASAVQTLAIIDIGTGQRVQSIEHTNHRFAFDAIYTVGEQTLPHKYEPNVEAVCAPGIHYFLDWKMALNYSIQEAHIIEISDGKVWFYDESGRCFLQR